MPTFLFSHIHRSNSLYLSISSAFSINWAENSARRNGYDFINPEVPASFRRGF